jgi:excisionase family DNA binding protein
VEVAHELDRRVEHGGALKPPSPGRFSSRKRPLYFAGIGRNVLGSGHMSSYFQRPDRRALSINDAAETCGLSRARLYRLIADGKLVTLKIGACRLVPIGAIDALLRGPQNDNQ